MIKFYIFKRDGDGYSFSVDNHIKIILPPFWKGVYSARKEFSPIIFIYFFFLE